jgi:hypothetical protein
MKNRLLVSRDRKILRSGANVGYPSVQHFLFGIALFTASLSTLLIMQSQEREKLLTFDLSWP